MRPVLLLALCAMAVAADPATAAAPSDLPVDLPAFLSATGAFAVGPDADGIVINSVMSDLPAASAGVERGDRLLAVDGLRVFSRAEYNLVESLLPVGHDAEHWSLRRASSVIEVELAGIQALGLSGVTFLAEPPQVAQAFQDAGMVPMEIDTVSELNHLPARVGQAVAAWHRAHPDAAAQAWLLHFAADWHALMHGAPATGTPEEMPVPLLAAIERLWHALGADKPEDAPSPARWGCDPAFAAVFLPYPPVQKLGFGAPVIADARVAARLKARFDPGGPEGDADVLAAMELAHGGYQSGATPADQFIGQCAASLIDDRYSGGWPYRSELIFEASVRSAMITELQRRLQAGDPDADLVRFALIGPLVIEHQDTAVRALINDLARHSLFIGQRALEIANDAADGWFHASKTMKWGYVEAYLGVLGTSQAPHGIIYPWALARSSALATGAGGNDLWTAIHEVVPSTFRGWPDLVAAALAPDAQEIAANADTMATTMVQCDTMMWNLAGDPAVADGEQAAILAEMMASSGSALDFNERDAIAAGYARAGDFTRAVRWERGAVLAADLSPWRERFLSRLGRFGRHEVFDMNDNQPGAAVREASADGTLSCVGQRTADGVAVGPWRYLRPDGSLQACGGYNATGLPEGVWRAYGTDGKLRIEAGFRGGRRFGRFRAWNEAGLLVVEGWYGQTNDIPLRFGPWTWYSPDGTRREAGRFVDNHRAGRWTIWNPAGAVVASAHFDDDQPAGDWPATEKAAPFMPPFQPPVPPPPTVTP